MNENRKSPALAGILSAMPGLGQVYVGYYISGFVNLIVVGGTISILSSGAAESLEPAVAFFLSFFWLFNIIDAVRKANLYNMHQMGAKEKPAPTDSPLVGGVVLLLAGLLFTMKITFGIEMDFLNQLWPLGLILGGVYLLWKYRRVRRQLQTQAAAPSPMGYAQSRDIADTEDSRDAM